MPSWLSYEPVVWTALVDAVLLAAIAFGAPITSEQKAAVSAVVLAISAMFVRSQVTPVAKLD
jgi:hypothetical protein